MVRLPPRSVVWTTLRVTVPAWVVLRGVVTAGTRLFPGMASDASVLLPVSVLLALSIGVLAVVDNARVRERIWVGNLGLGRRAVFLVGAGTGGLLEAGFRLIQSFGVGG